MKFRPLLIVCLMFCVGLFYGCGSTKINDGNNDLVEKLAVQVAVMKYIEGEADRAGAAERVISAVEDAVIFMDSDGVSIALLKERAMKRLLERGLSPSDYLIASAIIEAVDIELKDRVGDGILDAEKRVTVNLVLGWVAQAASVYLHR